MLVDTLSFTSGATLDNAVVESGSSLPSTSNSSLGELFYLTETAPGLYVYNGTTWILTSNVLGTLATLVDVSLNDLSEGQSLVYNGTNWINSTLSGDGGATAFDSLVGVVITSPSANQLLSYNGTNWINSPAPTYAFSGLSGISLSSPSTGQYLTYNGTNWINSAPPTAALASLTDVTIGTPTIGQLLSYSGSTWLPVNQTSLTYKGTWNPVTNTPTLVSGTGSTGNLYTVSTGVIPINAPLVGTYSGDGQHFTVTSVTGIVVGMAMYFGTTFLGYVGSISGNIVILTAVNNPGSISGNLTFYPTYLDGHVQFSVGDTVFYNGSNWNKVNGNYFPVTSFNTRFGDIILNLGDITTALGFTPANSTLVAPLASPALTGTPTSVTPSTSDSSTTISTTAYVKNNLVNYLTSTIAASTYLTLSSAASTYAPISSASLTGIPTAPTATTGTSTTQIATTAFVANTIIALAGGLNYTGTWNASTNTPTITSGTGTKGSLYKVSVAGTTTVDGISSWNIGDMLAFDGTTWDKIDGQSTEVSSVFGRVGAVVLMSSDVSSALGFTPANASLVAPLASPTLTGVPLAPTATPGTNTTQIATTAYVTSAVSTAAYVLPAATTTTSGGIIVGTGLTISSGSLSANVQTVAGRAGTVVLSTTDISGISAYAPLASPTLTGTPLAPTATSGTNTTQIATTAYVMSAISGISSGVTAFNTRTGAITLTTSDVATALGIASMASTAIGYNSNSTLGNFSILLGSAATPALDPTHTEAGITLSNSNLTATFAGGTGVCVTLGNTGLTGGKYYYELTFVSGTSSSNAAVGVVPQTESLTAQIGYNDGVGSTGVFQTSGNIYYNGGTADGTAENFSTAGNIVCVAVDATNRLVWFRTGTGNWNGSGTANPATDTGGIPIGGTATIYPAFCSDSASVWTINLAGSFTETIPSGYSAWASSAGSAAIGLGDVSVSGPINQQVLTYNSSSSKWINTSLSANTALTSILSPYALLASPALSGTPTTTTASLGNNTTQVSSTAFVYNATQVSSSVSTTGGATILSASQYGCAIIVVSGTLTSNATLTFPTSGQWTIYNSTTGGYSLILTNGSGSNITTVDQNGSQEIISLGSTGMVASSNTTPLASLGDSTDKIASTKYVTTAIAAAIGTPVAFSAYQSSAQTLSSTTFTKIQLQTKTFDTTVAFDNVTNYRYQPLVAGYYSVSGAITIGSSTTAIISAIYKNGSSFSAGVQAASSTTGTVSSVVYLNGSSDYIELWGYVTTGQALSAVATNTYFTAVLTSATAPTGPSLGLLTALLTANTFM